MKTRLAFVVMALVFLSGSLLAATEADEPVAIVCLLEGTAGLETPEGGESEIRLFDRLRAGSRVEVAQGAQVVLAFFDGRRFQLGSEAVAGIGANGLTDPRGPVKDLAAVPVMPKVAPIARQDPSLARAGAIRIRGGTLPPAMSDMQPLDGALVAPDTVRLRFASVEGSERYRVEVEDELANHVLSIETRTTEVEVPVGVLQPDRAYFWQVRALGGGTRTAQGEAMFVTLDADRSATRSELARQAGAASDPALFLLLAEYERGLGLRDESCRSLAAARALIPESTTIRARHERDCS